MDPQQQPAPTTPTQPQPSSDPSQPAITKAPKNHKKLALFLLIGPTAFFVLAIIAYAVLNFITSAEQSNSATGLFSEQSPLKTSANVLLFLVGALTVLTWLPGIIIGIILLSKK